MNGDTDQARTTPATAPRSGASGSSTAGSTSPITACSAEFLRVIPHEFARRHLLLSAGCKPVKDGGSEVEQVLVCNRSNPAAVFNVGVRLGRRVETIAADPEVIARLVDAAYAGHPEGPTTEAHPSEVPDAADMDRLLAEADRDLLSTAGKGAIVKLVDGILFEALGRSASDVHVQPSADGVQVRLRVDGVLHTARALPPKIADAVVSRIKVMGRMDIAERRVPQDGRATVFIGRRPEGKATSQSGGRAIDLRISTFPTPHGERVVVRLLESSGIKALATLESLGMPDDVRGTFLDRASRANGIVLLTGPTGSGKTTTLYATLRWLASAFRGELNIMTIEDPIEYELSVDGIAISQGQVNTKKGITFASGLRHILRQDPDVVMVGEIRDAETARIAIQASLTGHLVFSTLHTNDAASAVTRLVDLGVEPYLVSSSLSAVLAQRLVRRTHAACEGRGCGACFGSGLLGRTGLFELLAINEPLAELVAQRATTATLRNAARASGMRTLAQEGGRLARTGITTELEVAREVLGAADAGIPVTVSDQETARP